MGGRCTIHINMMKNMKIALLLILDVTLAACAPATVGAGTLNPILAATATTPAQVASGQTVYVQYTYQAGALNIPESRYEALTLGFTFRPPAGGEVSSPRSPAGWLKMKATGLPVGWNVELADAYLTKAVSSSGLSGDTITVYYYNRVNVVYRVSAPANASGIEVASLQFSDGDRLLGTTALLLESRK